jgi:hypothetical protein
MRRLIVLDWAAPALLASAVIAAARSDDAWLLVSLAVVVLLGLVAVNLVAPFLLWKRHGARSLIVPISLLAAASLSGAVAAYGSRLAVAGTPLSPDSFMRGARQAEMERLASQLLSGGPDDRVRASLRRYGFRVTRVDSLRRVVTLGYYGLRTWHEYIYAANGLPAPHSTRPVLSVGDIVNWGEVLRIAEQAAPETRRARGSVAFEPALAVPYFQRALGDTFLTALRLRPRPGKLSREEKLRVVAALNRQVAVESRLVEDAEIRYEGDPPTLHIGTYEISRGFWVSSLLKALLDRGSLNRAADGRHLAAKSGLSGAEQHEVEWLQLGLMNFIYGNLLETSDYAYDRRLMDRWYFRRS